MHCTTFNQSAKQTRKIAPKDVNLKNNTLQASKQFLFFSNDNILRTPFLNDNYIFTFQQIREKMMKKKDIPKNILKGIPKSHFKYFRRLQK